MHNRQKQRRDVSKFAALIATPATGAVSMPANARIFLLSRAGCAAGTTAATVTGSTVRTLKTPLLAAGESMRGEYAEEDSSVAPASGFDLLIDIGLGRTATIAEIA